MDAANRPSAEPAPRGYLSADHKRTYTISVSVLGAVFFLSQFIIPLVVMFGGMPAIMASGSLNMTMAHPDRGAYWAGRVWYPQSRLDTAKGESSGAALMFLPADAAAGPGHAADIPFADARLLADSDRLWVIAPRDMAYYQGNRLYLVPSFTQLGEISRPFLYKGRPAVIEDRPDTQRLMVFNGAGWQSELEFRIFSDDRLERIDCIQPLAEGDRIHAFVRYRGTIFFRDDLLHPPADGSDPWQAVAPAGEAWGSAMTAGGPVVFIQQHDGTAALTGYRKSGDRWEEFMELPRTFTTGVGVFAAEQPGSLVLVAQGFPGSLHRFLISGAQVAGKARYGRSFPFTGGMLALMLVPQTLTMLVPLLLAVIVSVLMRRHRVTHHETPVGSPPYASLTRRAFARMVDAMIMWLPMLIAGGYLLSSLLNADDPCSFVTLGFLKIFLLITGVFVWMLVCVVIFSIMEGRLGYSPGKRLLGIRVYGTDLQYCGFWRALVRNLLMIVDGFFNFFVGVMVVAFTEHWQRVGDLAARTVVVDTKER